MCCGESFHREPEGRAVMAPGEEPPASPRTCEEPEWGGGHRGPHNWSETERDWKPAQRFPNKQSQLPDVCT